MADRLQYPLLPSYIQQQSHQIPPHQQQQPQESLSSFPAFPDNPRMWQHPQQMRSHPPDISHPQMADLFRNQSMMRLQQAQGQPSSQQFAAGLAMPQLATNQNINGPPQPSQDLSTGQPQPSHMSPVNFNSISNPNAHMGPAAAQQRNNSLLQNFARPYDLGFPQNHHPQNGALAFANKQGIPSMQQQSRDQQHLQPPNHNPSADMFSSTMQNDAARRPSPSHPPMPSQHMQNGMMTSAAQQNNTHTQPVPQSSVSFASRPLQEQAMFLRNMIQTLNNNIAANRANPQDVDPMTKARVFATCVSKRDAAVKMLNNVLAQLQAQSGTGQGQMSWMQQQQQQQQQQGPSQPSFDAVSMPRNALGIQSSQSQVQHQPGNANPLVHPTQAGQVGGQNSLTLQPNSSSVQGNHVNAGSPFPSQSIVPPNAASFNVPSASLVQAQQAQRAANQPGGGHNPMLQTIPPLDKGRFEAVFKSFCNNKQIKIDQRLLTVNNRPIDLHMLHTLVAVEGGEAKVQQKDLWSVIGGRMGFVQFPGTDSTEPSKSGPVIAQQLEHIYRQFLAEFDRAYTANVLDSRMRNGPAFPFLNPSQLNVMVSMADQPVPQLKAQGLSEQMIQFIESHRSHLQRLRRERENSHDAMKPTMSEQAVQGQANGMPHINQMPGLRPSPFLQPGPQNNISQPGGHNVETRQQLTHQLPPQANINRPVKEQGQHVLALVAKVKQETMNNIHNRPFVNIPAEHRLEYNTLIEQLSRQATEMDNKLAMLYIYTRKEEFVRRLITLVVSIQHQRNLLSSPNPRFFISLENLRGLHQQMQQATETCSQLFAALSQQRLQMQQQQQQQQQQIPSGPRPLNARNSFPLDTSQIRPPGPPNPLLPSPNLQPPQRQQPTPPQISLHPPPPKKKGLTPAHSTAPHTTTSTPSPVPTSAHTPGPASVPSSSTPLNTNTPTPVLPPSSSSPPAPRSPKGKTTAKAKQAAAPAAKRRPSKTAPPPVPAESPAATAASSSTPNAKRPREEDDTVVDADSVRNNVSVASEPSPPKRIKTDWEIPPREELTKKAAEIKSESVEDANVFMEQMSELLKKTADNEGQNPALYGDLSETLGMLLKGCASETLDNGLFGEAVTGRESSPSTGFKDTFEEFIDYSFGQPDGQLDHEEGSKAHTPDLVSSSSTNLSPESNTDGENSSSTMSSLSDIRKDDPYDLRLGLWKEVDGGESAYHQPFEWKWDGLMPVLEQSWAVSTS